MLIDIFEQHERLEENNPHSDARPNIDVFMEINEAPKVPQLTVIDYMDPPHDAEFLLCCHYTIGKK